MTKIKFEVGPGEVQTIRDLSIDGKTGTITATKPNMEEILDTVRKAIEDSNGMPLNAIKEISRIRRIMPSIIAHEIASVQSMPDVNWDDLGKAYAALVASHDREPFIPRPARYLTDTERASMEKATKELDAELKEALKDRPRRPATPRNTVRVPNPLVPITDDPTEP